MISLSALMFMRLVLFYTETQIRLTGHSAPNAGRVEVRLHGIWGRVGDLYQSFGQKEAAVVCRQLGFPGVITALRHSPFGESSGLIMMSGVRCIGTETSITQCHYIRDWMKSYHSSGYGAGVICEPHGHDPDIIDIPVRLQGSSALSSGRVEILYAGVWGGIGGKDRDTNRKWDINGAHVVCRQLGYQAGVEALFTDSIYGPVSGPVWLTNVQCSGSESNLMSCSHDGIGKKSETHDRWNVASVICKDLSSSQGMHVRLRGFQLPNIGRVEVHFAGQWASIEANTWNMNAANVVCRQLGYMKAVSFGKGITCSKTNPCWFTSLQCYGDETFLDRCAKDFYSDDSPLLFEPRCASVMCKNGSTEGPGMRLSGSQVPHAGRVELLFNSVWGSINPWGLVPGFMDWNTITNNARVICRQLHFTDPVAVIPWFTYGESWTGLMWWIFSYMACSGSESKILDCYSGLIPETNSYGHDFDIGIVCKPGTPQANDFNVRLVGSSLPHTGTVEVRYYGVWGGVLGAGQFNINVGHVVCRQLGYPGAEKVFQHNKFGDVTRFLWIYKINCTGDETHLSQCTYVTWDKLTSSSEYQYLSVSNAASVICNVTQSANLKVRLAGSPINNAGRVEVLYQGVWGVISSSSPNMPWNVNEAIVVCRQLGYPGVISYGVTNQFGYATGPAWFSNVRCVGNESSLDLCAKDSYGYRNSYNMFVATVHCRLKQESDCANTTCENNGACVNFGDNAVCNCTEGFMGINCEIARAEVNPCQSRPCANTTTCYHNQSDYACISRTGGTGADKNGHGAVRRNKTVITSRVESGDALVVTVSVLAALVLLLTAVLVYVTLKYRRLKKQSNVPSMAFNNEAFGSESQNDPRKDESSRCHDLDLGTGATQQRGKESGKNDKQVEGKERCPIPPVPAPRDTSNNRSLAREAVVPANHSTEYYDDVASRETGKNEYMELTQRTGPNSSQYQSVSGGSESNTYTPLSQGASGDKNYSSLDPSLAVASGTDGNLHNDNEMKIDEELYEELPC